MTAALDELVVWLREQIAEDRRIAEESCDGPWHVNDAGYAEAIYGADGTCVIGGGRWGGEAPVFDSTEDALHIVRHDPRVVLAQCAAHEALLDEHWDVNEGDCATCVTGKWGYPTHGGSSPQRYPCKTIRIVALAYQHRPGYREEWRP
ncbi:hypothetical protein BBK82_03280 [Lentzea guizhouensis]|uniref:Uncharacterized protein n=1 Tax=Lentzea guizhouensis TaxID=1586287 RepID=A0A1B2HBY7_9PSEU|nr:DUF6221 family protein [Lentzea guizhouensis]ANZ35240.1 hypothetical protein BBK82_03280 [Lentzea guizhouensis]